MSTCTPKALKLSTRFGNRLTQKPEQAEQTRDTYISALKTMFSQKSAGSPEFIAKIVEASLSIPLTAYRGLTKKGSISKIQTYIDNNSLPAAQIQANFKLLGEDITGYSDIVTLIDSKANMGQSTVEPGKATLGNEVVAADSTDIAHNLLVNSETPRQLSVKDAQNDMATKKAYLASAVEGVKQDSPDRWAAVLQTYFPSSNRLGAEFTEWTRDNFFDMFVDFSSERKGFTMDINTEVKRFRAKLKKSLNNLSDVEYGDNNVDFSNRLLADINLAGVRKKYFTSVLLNDFDFIMETLIKVVGIDKGKTNRYNQTIDGFESEDKKLEPLLLNIYGKGMGSLFEKVPGEHERYALKDNVDPTIVKLSTTSTEFSNDATKDKSTFYHILGDDVYFYRNKNGKDIRLNPTKYYSYNGSSDRNTSSIDHYVNPLDNSSKFINNLLPLLKIINSDGTTGRRMTVGDFVTLAPLLVDVEPTLEAITTKLKELGEKNSTKVGAIARSLHSYIFSTNPTHSSKFYSIRMAARMTMYKNMNDDIVNALFSALISKHHVRYVKVEEGRVVTTKGPNKGSESQIIDEALAGYIVATDKYTKRGITKKLQVRGKTVLVDIGEEQKVDISKITSMEPDGSSKGMHIVALHMGLEDLYNDIVGTYYDLHSAAEAEKLVVETFKSIISVVAANSKDPDNRLALSAALERSKERVAIHKDYMYLSPSTLIKENEQKNLAEVFFVDSSKAQRIGDKTTQSSTTPNKNTTIKRQVKVAKKFNDDRVTPTDMRHMPMLIDEQEKGSSIVPVEIGDVFIKAPIVYDGNVVKLSDWDLKIRLEHAMFEGMLNAPKQNVGREFYLQVTNYSDKSSPELFQMTSKKNLLANDSGIGNELRQAYIEYNYRKNEAIQRVMLVSFEEFIVGEYEYIKNRIVEDAAYLGVDSAPRLEALLELKELLVSTDFNMQVGDMLKPFNEILDRVRINPAIIEESNADLDMGADYMTFKDNEAAFLKPTAGIRAALFRDSKTAEKLVSHYLAETKALLKKKTASKGSLDVYNVDMKRLEALLKTKKGITNNVDVFIERFFLINGVYGHSMKTLTMGDETFFDGRFDSDTQGEFYAKADADMSSNDAKVVELAGLEGIETMIKNQFKRAQSILTRGVVYAQKNTLRGLKTNSNRDNLLQHLEIYKGRGLNGKDIYRFKELEGNTLTELWGKGVISPIAPGTQLLSARNARGETLVKFNIGTQQVLVSTGVSSMSPLISENLPIELVQGIQDLVENRINTVDSAINLEQELLDDQIDTSRLSPTTTKYRDVSLNMGDIKEHYRKLAASKGDPIMQPDFLPSMLMSDPWSYVNLMNKMDVNQETTDGIQYIHPLYYIIKQRARGGDIGAFNTKDWNAQKTIATHVDYGKNRQTLLKNSGQMPFSMAQMSKVGGQELFNAFKTLNTAIDFKQNTFIYERIIDGVMEVDQRLARTRINNLDDLFTYFDGYGKQGDNAWHQVLEVLRQNPIDMFSFVAHLNVPSNQKTGRKKFNKFENVFSSSREDVKVVEDNVATGRDFVSTPNVKIDYLSNEFNFEVLTKEHGYDVSGKLNQRSSLALLSQLVNAVSFGGLSNVDAMSLQNAMGGRMRLNRLRVGRDLAIVGKEMAKRKDTKYLPTDYLTVTTRLQTGDVSTNKTSKFAEYTPQQQELYEDIIRAGVYSMAQLAFNEAADSVLIKKMIEGEKHLIGEEEVNTLYSLDTPAIQNKVMGTLRAAFFGDTVKMRMEGFQAVVSATHKTVNVYDFNGGRKARGAYIRAGLEAGMNHNWKKEGGAIVHVNSADMATMSMVSTNVLPFDKVKVVSTVKIFNKHGKQIDAKQSESYHNKNNIDFSKYNGRVEKTIPESDGVYRKTQDDLYVIITPDVLYNKYITQANYDAKGENTLIKVRTGLNDHDTYFKWYLETKFSTEEIDDLIASGKLEEDITEKYSLQWYQITRKENDKTIDIKDTKAFRSYYKAVMESPLDEKESAKYRAAMILETQRKNAGGKPIWDMIPAEIILPAYMKDRFGMPDESSLHDMIGHSTTIEEQTLFLKERLRDITPRGKRYAIITNSGEGKKNKHYSKMITRIYNSRAIVEKSDWYNDIVKHLETVEKAHIDNTVAENAARGVELDPHDVELSQATIDYINEKKNDAFEAHLTQLTTSFMQMLETVSTRIPGQSKQSGFVGRVVEFLDAQGNAAFAPTEHIVTTGGDFDIDTLSVLTKTMDAEGKVYDDSPYRDPETDVFDFDLLNTAYNDELIEVYESIGKYVDKYNKEAVDYVARIERRIATAKKNGSTNAQIAELETSLGFAKTNEIDSDKEQKLIETIISGIHSRYENILANTVANSVMGSLNNVDTTVEVNTPISMGMFKPIQARLKQTFGEPVALGMNGETFWPIIKYEELAAQGKEAIGMFATALKINSAVQAAEMNYVKKYAAKHGKKDTTNPFIFDHSISFTRTNEDGSKTAVTRYRKSFADLDRFDVNRTIAGSKDIQDKLESLRKGEDEYMDSALPTLVGIIEEEISSSIGNTNNNANPFTFEEKTALVEEFGEEAGTNVFDETLLLHLQGYLPKGFVQIDDAFLGKISNALYEGKRVPVQVFSKRVDDSLIVPNKKNIAVFNGILESTFGIEVPAYVAESTAPVRELKDYLSRNPDVVEEAFLNIIGKQLSNDVQSQFLSAATDNAKALILGKVRSGSLTNPIITTMMIMGYEIDDIIDFLYDSSIEAILLHFAAEKSTLRHVSLTSGAVTKLDSYNGASKTSLIELLEVGEQITKFRDVRSLNENAKIEPSALDKIIQNIDPDGILYRAIIEDNFALLEIGNDAAPAVKIFNATQMVFLHPQSRDLYMNLYESEMHKMPALFRSTIEAREQAGKKGRDPITYKNIFTALAALKVEAFLNKPVVETDDEGNVTKESWRLGEIMAMNDDGTPDPTNITRVRLDNPANRERFVHSFPDYWKYAKTMFPGNTGLESIAFTNTYKSTKSILAIPKLKGSNVDSADAALIFDGFRELKTMDTVLDNVPGETAKEKKKRLQEAKERAQFKIRLYNNLSLYALIVSKGEVKKGSMIEAFDEITFELGKFLNTLSQEYYKDNFRPSDDIVAALMSGNIPTEAELGDMLSGRTRNTEGFNEDFDDEAYANRENEDSYLEQGRENEDNREDEDREDGEVGYVSRASYTYSISSKAQDVMLGTAANQGHVFRVVDPNLKDAIFYSAGVNEIAYRIFDIVADEALPHSTNVSFKEHSAIPFADELGKAGKQIGFTVEWGGEKAWIINYAGIGNAPNVETEFETYTVQTKDGKEISVPGVLLMKENTELFLKGNIIEHKNARNIRLYNQLKETDDITLRYLPENITIQHYNGQIDDVLKDAFNHMDIKGDPIVATEVRLLSGLAGSVIKTTPIPAGTETISFDEYMDNDEILKANFLTRNVLVPSLKIPKDQRGVSEEENAIIPEIKEQIGDAINSLAVGKTMTFYGMMDNGQLDYAKDDYRLAGGINIVENFVSSAIDKSKKKGGKNTLMKGAFKVKRILLKGEAGFEYRVTRVGDGRFLTMVGKKTVSLWINPDTGRIETNATGNTKKTAVYKAIDKGYSRLTHSKYRVTIEGRKYDAMVINKLTGPETVIKIPREGYNTEYYKVSPAQSYTGFRADYSTFYASPEVLASINNQISKENVIPTNLKCN